MNVNEVEAVASQVDFVFSAVDMSKDEIRAMERGICQDRNACCFQQLRTQDGHRMFR